MPESKRRFVHLCRHVLALSTVVALTAPALGVATLDLVAPAPSEPTSRAAQAGRPGSTSPSALVASHPVKPEVTEIPIKGIAHADAQALTRRPATGQRTAKHLAALTPAEKVTGLATVGVTWNHRIHLDDRDITVSVRTLDHGRWSPWQPVEYHDDHGPDPGSAEAQKARPGTDPIVVGDVDDVQVKIETADGRLPAGAELAVVDPRTTPAPRLATPAIDTAHLPPAGAVALSSSTTGATPLGGAVRASAGAAVLSAAMRVTPKPQIFSRAQWGADESMRDPGALHYDEVHAGFVHHTVNANTYTRAQVPAMLRGIYAYHTQSKGWSDIGYNFVVDRFGRIWEGRYGGVDRPVVGAHTLNYNEYSFAMSALGNFEKGKPSAAMLDAYGRLFAWKLSLHGVPSGSARQWVGSRFFRAINGHRDAGKTACPGRYLYAKLPAIRALAAKYQASFAARARTADLAGSRWPDLVVRDTVTQHAYLVRTGGQTNFNAGRRAVSRWKGMDLIAATRDVTGDRIPDVLARNASTRLTGVYPGTARGTLGAPVRMVSKFSRADQLVGTLDITGDGRNDVVARMAGSATLWVYPGNGRGGFMPRRVLSQDWAGYNVTAGAGDLDGDGRNDLVARRSGRLYLVPGQQRGLGTPVALPGTWGQYSVIAGAGDLTNDRVADLLVKVRTSRLVYLIPGDGAGGFRRALGPFNQFKDLNYLAPVGHLAGNRAIDLLGRNGNGVMAVYPNNGRRNLDGVTDTGISLEASNLVLNVEDWNGDGFGDLMTRETDTGDMYLRPGNGRGGFGDPVLAATGWGRVNLLAAVGDITGDGHPDLMGQPAGMAMQIYPGDGVTGFLPSYTAHSAIASSGHTGLGLWNADGSPDSLLRRSDGSLMFYPGNGPGGLMSPRRIGTGATSYDWLQAVGDATGDGRPDVLARQSGTGDLWLLPGNAAGFGARRFVADGFAGFDLSS